MKVQGKVVVVTGAANGMGRELALLLLKKGAKVAIADINEAGLHETAKLADVSPDRIFIHKLDVSNKEEVFKFPELVISALGQVDVLINNAGIIHAFIPVKELDIETCERVMRINFFGTLYMTKAFLPYLAERPEAHLANVSSMGGYMPFPGQTLYGCSKAAVKLLTEGLQSELRESKIGVTLLYPGAVNTNIMNNSGLDINKAELEKNSSVPMLTASQAAVIMIDAIEKNKKRVTVGKDSTLLDKLYRLAPSWAGNFIAKQMAQAGI